SFAYSCGAGLLSRPHCFQMLSYAARLIVAGTYAFVSRAVRPRSADGFTSSAPAKDTALSNNARNQNRLRQRFINRPLERATLDIVPRRVVNASLREKRWARTPRRRWTGRRRTR